MPEYSVIPSFPNPEDFPKPASIDLISKNTVMVIVDMQNDFVQHKGKIYTGPMVDGIVPKIHDLLNLAREKGVKTICTQSLVRKG